MRGEQKIQSLTISPRNRDLTRNLSSLPICLPLYHFIYITLILYILSFIAHYEGSRTPYVVIIDAAWMKTDFKREGTVEFMDYVRAGFPVSRNQQKWNKGCEGGNSTIGILRRQIYWYYYYYICYRSTFDR